VPLKEICGGAGQSFFMTEVEAKQVTEAPRALGTWVLVLVGSAVSGLAILAASCFHQSPPSEAAKAAGIKAGSHDVTLSRNAPQWQSIRLGTATPAAAGWSDAFPARFKVNDANAARVGTPLAGRVTRVLVELGDPVKAGAPLFSVASSDVASLRSEQQRALVELGAAKERQQRVQAMVDAHAAPGKDQLEAAAQLQQAELGVRLANAKLTSLRVSATAENEFTVVAPRDGVVVEKSVLPAQQVSPEQSLVGVADMSTVWAVAEIFEADAQGIGAKTLARLTRAELAGFALESPVDMVASVVDPERHTVSVRVVVPNSDRRIRPNTYVEMRFLQQPVAGAVEIGASALVSDGADKYVYVQEAEGRFVRRQVVAASSSKNRVVVTSGLHAGEQVVEEGSALIDNEIALTN
jgi:RND family efflux transporter MFP subunit